MESLVLNSDSENIGEVVIYQPDEITRIDVQINNETVWLTQAQIAKLFGVGQPAISKHLKNIFRSGELDIKSVYSILEYTASDGKTYKTGFYNLDAILSVGYRVNSKNATHFRQWANCILKEYLLKGHAYNVRLSQMNKEVNRQLDIHTRTLMEHDSILKEHSQKIDFFIRTSLPPVEGIFFDGQIYDAYAFVSRLIRSAVKQIVLIDNYIDDSVLTMMDKRNGNVKAIIYTTKVSRQLQLDIQKHNAQYPQIEIHEFTKSHDRFLIIDEKVYLIGASIKDLGKKWFGFTLMESISAEEIMERL